SSATSSAAVSLRAMPALLTRMSIRPCSRTIASATALTRAESRTSRTTSAPERSPVITRAPASVSASAAARPMPWAAPVAKAARPSSRSLSRYMGRSSGKEARGGHDRLEHGLAALQLIDLAGRGIELLPGQLAVRSEIHPDPVDPVGQLLRRAHPRQPLRSGDARQRVEDEGQLHAMAGAELAAKGVRAPVQLVEMGAALMRRGIDPRRPAEHEIVHRIRQRLAGLRSLPAQPIGLQRLAGIGHGPAERESGEQ